MKKAAIGRRKIRLSLEGWYYSFVLVFIAGAAILRRANLLLILAALMTAPLIFNWRFVYSTLKNLFFSRQLPRHIVAGTLFDIQLDIENERFDLDSWGIQIDEQISTADDSEVDRVEVAVEKIPYGESTSVSYQCLLMNRGVYRFRQTTISTSFPSGLVRAFSEVDLCEEILVSPRLGILSMQWKDWLSPDEIDEPRAIGRKGINDGLFYAIRDYRSGDSRQSIHWRSTAKLGRPAVKQFEKQTDEEFNIVFDLAHIAKEPTQNASGTSQVKTTDKDNSEYCLSFLATILDQICNAGQCELNLLLLGQRKKFFHGHASQKLLEDIGHELARFTIAKSDQALAGISEFVNVRQLTAPVMVFSNRPSIESNETITSYESGTNTAKFCVADRLGRENLVMWINANEPSFGECFRLGPVVVNTATDSGATT